MSKTTQMCTHDDFHYSQERTDKYKTRAILVRCRICGDVWMFTTPDDRVRDLDHLELQSVLLNKILKVIDDNTIKG
jgi:hypothetical protein